MPSRKEPEWIIVLNTMYENMITVNPENFGEGENIVNPVSVEYMWKHYQIRRMSELNDEQINNALSHMENVGLVESHEGYNEKLDKMEENFGLTEKGFEVAHEHRLRKQQQNIRTQTARLSGYLVAAIVFQGFSGFDFPIVPTLVVSFALAVSVWILTEYLVGRWWQKYIWKITSVFQDYKNRVKTMFR
ncbi:MAG: hypothetical protein U5J64_10910 [Halobacteriales archaeon]|nr:hypothetical protein [Halobacteriales archaeon]